MKNGSHRMSFARRVCVMAAVLMPVSMLSPVVAQDLGSGVEFSILDYLEAGSVENTPDQWIAEA
jgi:hypothetical protein